MKKLMYVIALAILMSSGILSSCTEDEVKVEVPKGGDSNPQQW